MIKFDYVSYLKILAGMLLIFPLVHVYFALDFGLRKGGLIATFTYIILMLIAIPLFNYLQYGRFWYWVVLKEGETYYGEKENHRKYWSQEK